MRENRSKIKIKAHKTKVTIYMFVVNRILFFLPSCLVHIYHYNRIFSWYGLDWLIGRIIFMQDEYPALPQSKSKEKAEKGKISSFWIKWNKLSSTVANQALQTSRYENALAIFQVSLLLQVLFHLHISLDIILICILIRCQSILILFLCSNRKRKFTS